MAGCADEKLSPNSVITADKRTPTPLDLWLDRYYVSTYNINFKYRYEDIESDMKYYTVPASYQMAIKMANLVKYSCLEAFDEVAGPDFTKANFPKLIYLTGNWEYKNNGTFILGTAEGGKKILLAGTNFIDKFIQSAEDINTYYLKTVYHEFTHILNQTKPYSGYRLRVRGRQMEREPIRQHQLLLRAWFHLGLCPTFRRGRLRRDVLHLRYQLSEKVERLAGYCQCKRTKGQYLNQARLCSELHA